MEKKKMNLIDLNETLYETIKKIESGALDVKKAQAIVNVSSAIAANSKLMIEAAKLAKNPTVSNQLIGERVALPSHDKKDVYERKLEFALSKGYESLASAFEKMGKYEFESEFRDYEINK